MSSLQCAECLKGSAKIGCKRDLRDVDAFTNDPKVVNSLLKKDLHGHLSSHSKNWSFLIKQLDHSFLVLE